MEAKNPAIVCEKLVRFVRTEMAERGFTHLVLGLSGGIDSAVVAKIAQIALDLPITDWVEISPRQLQKAQNLPLLCVFMPSVHSSPQSAKDARELACLCGLPLLTLPLADFETALHKLYANSELAGLRLGNACARFRMTLLFDLAFAQNRLVLGTSNKSERMLGYGTIYGDLAAGINPLGNLYKTDIFALAEYLKIPQSICTKPPSADLFEGQSDENDLGYSYALLDAILSDFLDHNHSREQLLCNYDAKAVNDVLQRYEKNRFKRELVPLAVV